jgi:ornithine carbamoyltransferase
MIAVGQQIHPVVAANFTRDLDLSTSELGALLDLSADVKRSPREFRRELEGKSAALLFEKPSLRTRATFELAVQQLGGSVFASDGPIGGREPVRDVARNLARWVDVIVARTFAQDTIDELAHWSRVPVVNALSDLYHPCQALADMLTVSEHFGGFEGRTLAFVGDGNNVAHSLMLCAARLGLNLVVATPTGYAPRESIVSQAQAFAEDSGAAITLTNDPVAAVTGANAVYTDVWASMGQESEAAERRRIFAPYQVNEELLAHAPDALFMHCLPAKRGEEVTDQIMESPRSVAFDQAENRLHVQKALLLMLTAN